MPRLVVSALPPVMTGSGISRKPERFGGSVSDETRDALRTQLEIFEVRCANADPGQKELLQQGLDALRAETKELERFRGVWHQRGLPGVERDWNDMKEPANAVPPLEDTRYKAYLAEREREKRLQLRDGD